MASAVFNSFSNMLYAKRDPVDIKDTPSIECEHAPLTGADVKELAPPPRDLTAGTSSYRIATKKKAYAQLPGLITGNVPRFPPTGNSDDIETIFPPKMITLNASLSNTQSMKNAYLEIFPDNVQTQTNNLEMKYDHDNNDHKLVERNSSADVSEIINIMTNMEIATPSDVPNKTDGHLLFSDNLQPVESNNQTHNTDCAESVSEQKFSYDNQESTKENAIALPCLPLLNSSFDMPLLPPPPMFSNVKNYNSKEEDRSILPPSVARRIYGKKTSAMSTVTMQTILVPSSLHLNEDNAHSSSTDSNISSRMKNDLNTDVLTDLSKEIPSLNLSQCTTTGFIATPPSHQNVVHNSLQSYEPVLQQTYNFSPENFVTTETSQDFISDKLKDVNSTLTKPPKLATQDRTYRLQKTKRQYYSGPATHIEVVNQNFKPCLASMEPINFHEIPDVDNTENLGSIYDSLHQNTDQSGCYSSSIDNNLVSAESIFDTMFDVSRKENDNERPKTDITGFGIIGSLKSKLSSLNINKIQDSVTTFFDPVYNERKPKIEQKEIEVLNDHTVKSDLICPTFQSDFSVFVPNQDADSVNSLSNIYVTNDVNGNNVSVGPTNKYLYSTPFELQSSSSDANLTSIIENNPYNTLPINNSFISNTTCIDNASNMSHSFTSISAFNEPFRYDKGFSNITKQCGNSLQSCFAPEIKELTGSIVQVSEANDTYIPHMASTSLDNYRNKMNSENNSHRFYGVDIYNFSNNKLDPSVQCSELEETVHEVVKAVLNTEDYCVDENNLKISTTNLLSIPATDTIEYTVSQSFHAVETSSITQLTKDISIRKHIGFPDNSFSNQNSGETLSRLETSYRSFHDMLEKKNKNNDIWESDKSGMLDVNSIEQDATTDRLENLDEFVITPTKKDLDEQVLSLKEIVSDVDTFTSRIQEYNKMINASRMDPNPALFGLSEYANARSPAINMASYFDTGNFAADTHFKNVVYPTVTSNIASTQQLIEPNSAFNFYDKTQNIFTLAKDIYGNIVLIPDTSTQTRPTATPSFGHCLNNPENTVSFPCTSLSSDVINKHPINDDIYFKTKSDEFSLGYDVSKEDALIPKLSPTFNKSNDELSTNLIDNQQHPVEKNTSQSKDDVVPVEFRGIFPEGSCIRNTSNIQPPIIQQISPTHHELCLDHRESVSETNDSSISGSRLASYFNVPCSQNDPSKPFFELSQSQNHLRHNQTQNDIVTRLDTIQTPNVCSQPSVSYNYLMNDLTSVNNFNSTNPIVRTVNYFTVEYDNIKIGKNDKPLLTNAIVDKSLHKSKPFSINDVNNTIENEDEKLLEKNAALEVQKCEYCCNFAFNHFDFINVSGLENKLKKAMDSNNTSASKETDKSTCQNREVGKMEVKFDEDIAKEEANNAITLRSESRSSGEYSPVKHHWFYRVESEGKSLWRGFSVADSKALEEAFHRSNLDENTVVATDGGRYDVNIVSRLRTAVYWKDKPTNVRRCSWFYKGTTDARYVPYTEAVAEKLEELYRLCLTSGEWHRRLSLPHSELVMLHSPGVMVHLLHAAPGDAYAAPNQSTMRPKVVRRGCEESEIEDTEPSNIDHLLLLCHGVGSACDMRFRSVEEVVDDFRATSLQLIQAHYKNSYESGLVGRVEVLPISWHSTLHSGERGVDRRLAQITLESIPRLRSFTNDTVLDVLFYTSPVFCQTIIDTVCGELNRIYELFKRRNPSFKGGVSLGGHSLGSVILYDLLCHQRSTSASETRDSSKTFVASSSVTGQPSVKYPTLVFEPDAMYGLGSPIAIFECIRGVESLGSDFCLPTCRNFFNIFHPYDPIAYRIEPLINSSLKDLKPTLIPHHKGRKRMHLELKDTMTRVGADIKAKFMESVKYAWFSMWRTPPPPTGQLEKVVEEELEKESGGDEAKDDASRASVLTEGQLPPGALGRLNGGRRVDYVLQEAPFEMINEYLFAMSSHVCYWESEDTMLLMLREIYDKVGIMPDGTIPMNSMTIERTRTPTPEEMEKNHSKESPSTSHQ